MQYLIEEVGKISSRHKEDALIGAVLKNHLPCVEYFIKNVGEISSKKGWVFRWAAKNGHLSCVEFLIKNAGREISSEKEAALIGAAKNDHYEVEAHLNHYFYLERCISSNANPAPALIFTAMSHGENKDEEMKDASSKKREREEDNENEKPENNKENENNAKWPYCSLM